jgi:hypothetical protein
MIATKGPLKKVIDSTPLDFKHVVHGSSDGISHSRGGLVDSPVSCACYLLCGCVCS